jgi:kynurenine formamidase
MKEASMAQSTATELSLAGFQELFEQCSNWGRWGADDERGTLNLITPLETKRAASLVQHGETVSCAWPLNTVPSAENRSPALHLMVRAGDIVDTAANRSTADYLALAPHGLAHSHLDALCHVSWQGKLYNDRPVSLVTSNGATKLAITIGQNGIVSRGVLLDIPLSKGADSLEPGYAITPADLEAAESAAGIRVEPGDILLIRTGRHTRQRLYGTWDTGALMAGLHFTCAPWLKERNVALLGSDGISDVRPSSVEGTTLPIHVLTLAALGLQLLDNLNLDDLSGACARHSRWEFSLTIAPLRLERGTASAVNPIAVF